MIDRFYIPTLGRVENQITWNNLPDFVKEISVLAIPPQEENLHKEIPTIVVPVKFTGIAKTREWLWSISGNLKWGMFDDDLKFSVRTPNGETSKREFTNENWKDLIGTTDSWLENIFVVGVRQGNLPPSGKDYIENSNINTVYFFNGKKLPKGNELDWSLQFAEDLHLNLQLLKSGYKNRIWDKYVFMGTQYAEGGCSDTRTVETINESHEKLMKEHPGYVRWNGITKGVLGGELKKIRVSYKKAYTDSLKSTLGNFYE